MKKYLVRDLMYLYTSLFNSAMRNIVTQMFCDKYYQDNKETLVSIALFAGALCAMFGIKASSNIIGKNASKSYKRKAVIFMTIVVSLSFVSAFIVHSFIAYTLLFGIANFGINYMYNLFDVFISSTVSPEEHEKNIRIFLVYQMAGNILGPLIFSFFEDTVWACIVLSLGIQLAGYISIGLEYVKSDENSPINIINKINNKIRSDNASVVDENVKNNDKKAILYCFLMHCAVNMLTPSIAYLMKDYLKVDNYAVKSSLFLTVITIVAAGIIILTSAKRMWSLSSVAALALGVSVAAMIIFKSSNLVLLGVLGLLSGSGYGMFLSGSRYYVNSAEPERNLVYRYNKIMTEAILFGFLISALVSWSCEKSHIPVIPAKFCLIIFLLALSAYKGTIPELRKKHSA